MQLKDCLAVVLLALAPAGIAQDDASPAKTSWTRASSGHVEVYTDSGRGTAARILAETLRFHAACAAIYRLPPDSPPLSVVYFASEADFRRIRGEGYSKGFFQRQGDSTWIVLHAGPDSVRRLRHELVHLINDQSGLSPAPAWLNEGLAEYWSALDLNVSAKAQPRAAPILTLLQLLAGSGAFSAGALDNARQDADQALFYARSWLLVKRLIEDGGMDRVLRLGTLLARGGDADAAYRLVYSAGLDSLIARAQNSPGLAGSPGGWVEQNWPPPAAVNESLLSNFDAELMLGELASSTGALTESQQRYEKALAAAGRGPDSHSRLALLALRRGDRDEALRLMQSAARAGTRDARMWYEYALLLREGGAAQELWVKAARRATELDPERAEAWFILGSAIQGAEAVDALARAARSAQSRSWMWEAYGRALLGTGRKAEARVAAAEALKRARRPRERAMAEGLLADIDAPPLPLRPTGPATVTPESWNHRQSASSVQGRLVEVDCSGPAPVLVVDAPAGRARISVKQTTGLDLPANMNFTCGPQSPQRPAIFGHDALADTQLKTAGDLRSIRFE
jgi:hypothetical protein